MVEAAPAAKTLAIGLLWHSVASGNLGVGALTVGNMVLVRRAAEKVGVAVRFVIPGPRDDGPAYVTGPDVTAAVMDSRYLLSPSGWTRTAGTLDLVLDIGAGDSWTDIYHWRRFLFLWLSKMAVIARGRPLLFSPQTIGPFTRQPYSAMAALAMKGATAVVARDPASYAVARRMAPATPTIEAVDVAFALPFQRRARAPGGPAEIGINVSGLLFNRGVPGDNKFGLGFDYAALSRALIGTLAARPDLRVHLICHVNSARVPEDDDGRIADRLAAEFPRTVRVPDFVSPEAAKSYISGLDLLVAGRMHACIAAFSSGVPCVPVAYSRKFTGLFGELLGYPHVVPVSGLDTDGALAFILDRIERRDELTSDTARGNARVAERLARYDALLVDLIAKASGRRR